jgi:hypothetical protein
MATISGGVVDVGNRFLMGGQTATGIVVNHSGGELKTVLDVRVGDGSAGTSTYNLSGTGLINSTTGGYVGRAGTAKFFQTGGTANFNGTLNIGNRDSLTLANDGLYEISAGDLNLGLNLNIAQNGIGQFRVVGDDGTIDVAGAFDLNTSGNGNGTLAYELEAGDSLSTINVVGNATFDNGTSLLLDDSNVAPSQTTYDLLAAADIIDNGLVFTGPAGWTVGIVTSGSGEILRAFALGAVEDADFDADGDVDGADFLTWQRNQQTANPTLAQGDANDDNAVDGDDLAIWEEQFGAPSVAAAAAVPEPCAMALLLCGAATVACGARIRIARRCR